MKSVEVTIQNLIGSGMDPKTENNPYLGFVYTSFQERATKAREGLQPRSSFWPYQAVWCQRTGQPVWSEHLLYFNKSAARLSEAARSTICRQLDTVLTFEVVHSIPLFRSFSYAPSAPLLMRFTLRRLLTETLLASLRSTATSSSPRRVCSHAGL